MTDFPQRLLILGCGNMAGAMLDGWLVAGLDPARVTVVDPGARALPAGVTHHPALPDDLPPPDMVLLGVKPQIFGAVAPALAKAPIGDALVVSILAGVEVASLRAALPTAGAVLRAMPNMAVRIGKSVIGIVGEELSSERRRSVEALMGQLGLVEWLADEEQMHLFIALAGSGPAYVFRFIDALAKGAGALGMDEAQAARFALAMVEGAALLAAASDDDPGALADKVASPGGTTREGMNVLDADGALDNLVRCTLDAAARRSAEMAAETRG